MPAALLLACALSAPNAQWVNSLWDTWQALSSQLPTGSAPTPTLVTFDASCQWTFDGRTLVGSRAHTGMIRLPDGEDMPPVVTSFAGAYGADDRPFVVISAPAIWKAQPNLQSEPRLDMLIRGVFVHEMTHVVQTRVMGPLLDRLSRRLPDPDSLNDDIIQDTFGDDPDFRRDYERERDLLYAATTEADAARRSAVVDEALAVMESRRARHFTGDKAFYRELEDAFLVMEGAANWAAYQALRAEGLSGADALTLLRRGGRRWSQDEGLALFLVLDAQRSNWRERVFGRDLPPSVPRLLRP